MTENRLPQSSKKIAFAALYHRSFRFFFMYTVLAMMADNIEHVVSYWLLFQKFHSPTLAGFAEISHWTPFLLLSVYFGGIADRYDCRKVIQVAQIIFMGVSATWAILFFTDTIQPWHAVILLIIHGMAGVIWSPAEQLLIHDIVGHEHIQSAVRLNATSRQLGILFGPAVGSGLMLLLGPSRALLANILIYLPLTLWLLIVPYTGHLREKAAAAKRLAWSEAIQLLRAVAQNRPIITMIILGGSASLLVGNVFQTLMPAFAVDLGAEQADFAYSALLMATAAGAVTGGFLLEGKGWLQAKPLNAIGCAILWCIAITAFAFSTNYYLVDRIAVFRRYSESCVLFLSPGHRADSCARPSARPIGRSFHDVRTGTSRFQWSNCRRYRRIDRCSPVAGPQRNRSFCRHNLTLCVCTSSPERGKTSGIIQIVREGWE